MTGTEKIHAMWLFNKKAKKKERKILRGSIRYFRENISGLCMHNAIKCKINVLIYH